MAKKKTGVSEVETQPVVNEVEETEINLENLTEEEIAHADEMLEGTDEEQEQKTTDEDFEIDLSDKSDEVDVEPAEEEEPTDTKIKTMPNDELAKAYKNLEKVVGRQGQELGELRKLKETVKEPQTPEEKIKAMSDTELESTINIFKADILKPNAAIEDEDYSQKVILYNDLKEERTIRLIDRQTQSKNAQQNNEKTIKEFTATWGKALGDNTEAVIDFAKKKLSDQYGNITSDDLEVALHKLNPALYRKSIQLLSTEEDRKRIAKAEATKQPRLSGAGSSSTAANTISISKLQAMDEYELSEFLDKVPYETALKIEKELRKHNT